MEGDERGVHTFLLSRCRMVDSQGEKEQKFGVLFLG